MFLLRGSAMNILLKLRDSRIALINGELRALPSI